MTDRSPLTQRLSEIRDGMVTIPFDVDSLERRASEVLPEQASEYVRASAGTGGTLRANQTAFDRWRVMPRVLQDVADRDLSVTAFDERLPVPLMLAPIGGQTQYHEDGELGTARAAASLTVPVTLSTTASHTIEDVAAEMGDTTRFFQLYPLSDEDVTASLVSRAESAGYGAILVTIDSEIQRWTPAALPGSYRSESALPNVASDPVAQNKGLTAPGDVEIDKYATWDDLATVRSYTDLPIVAKGISHPRDAQKAIEYGMDGVVVSNHGGRSLDGAVGALTTLPAIVDVVDGRVPVLFDSGIRSGVDVFKAIALGADAVFVGRPFVYGLAINGEQGVYEAIHNLLAEFDSVLGLAGYDTVRSVGRDALISTETIADLRRQADVYSGDVGW